MLGLERAGARQVEIVGLGGAERRQLDAELVGVGAAIAGAFGEPSRIIA
jgi:hypothetical protein